MYVMSEPHQSVYGKATVFLQVHYTAGAPTAVGMSLQASRTTPLEACFAKSASGEKSWCIIARLTKIHLEDDQAAYRLSE